LLDSAVNIGSGFGGVVAWVRNLEVRPFIREESSNLLDSIFSGRRGEVHFASCGINVQERVDDVR
jgi:hypothetical protein